MLIYRITEQDIPRVVLNAASMQVLITSILDDRKAHNIVSLDVTGKSDVTDAMIVASGTSRRHVAALAQHVINGFEAVGLQPMVEGLESCDWVLVDAGDVVVHLFHPDVRDYYRLEKMWSVPTLGQTDEFICA